MGRWDGVDQIWDMLDDLSRQEEENKFSNKLKKFFRRIFK